MPLPLRRTLGGLSLGALAFALACGGGGDAPVGPDPADDPPPPSEPPPPGPGPHFSVLPVPLGKLARITPLGYHNKILPVGHTYWEMCERAWILPTTRPCLQGRLDLRAAGSGVVWAMDPSEDGTITIMGPPGVYATYAHVTPRAGLQIGDSVQAGDTIARMYSEFNFDFGVIHTGLEPHQWVNMDRVPAGYAQSFSPIGQYPEPLRSQLAALVPTFEDPLGRLSFDVEGTAQGNWFEEGTPEDISFRFDQVHRQLFLGRLQERHSVRVIKPGWVAHLVGLAAIDPAAPSWDEITPSTGPVVLKAWSIARDATEDLTFPRGTFILEMLDPDRLRIEWFDTHDPVEAFTGNARIFER